MLFHSPSLLISNWLAHLRDSTPAIQLTAVPTFHFAALFLVLLSSLLSILIIEETSACFPRVQKPRNPRNAAPEARKGNETNYLLGPP